jgi:hypothetical protein
MPRRRNTVGSRATVATTTTTTTTTAVAAPDRRRGVGRVAGPPRVRAPRAAPHPSRAPGCGGRWTRRWDVGAGVLQHHSLQLQEHRHQEADGRDVPPAQAFPRDGVRDAHPLGEELPQALQHLVGVEDVVLRGGGPPVHFVQLVVEHAFKHCDKHGGGQGLELFDAFNGRRLHANEPQQLVGIRQQLRILCTVQTKAAGHMAGGRVHQGSWRRGPPERT